MLQRGRKSAESLSLVRVGVGERPEPPARLSAPERDIWREITAGKPADWFGADNLPLLEHYCAAILASRQIAERLRATSTECLDDYERLISLATKVGGQLATLATKMRLTQQSRYNEKTASTAANRGAAAARKPWEFGS